MTRCNRCNGQIFNNFRRHQELCHDFAMEVSDDDSILSDDLFIPEVTTENASNPDHDSNDQYSMCSSRHNNGDRFIQSSPLNDYTDFDDFDFGEDNQQQPYQHDYLEYEDSDSEVSNMDLFEDYFVYDDEDISDQSRNYHQTEDGIRIIDFRDQATPTDNDYWNLRLATLIVSNNITRKGHEDIINFCNDWRKSKDFCKCCYILFYYTKEAIFILYILTY